MISSLAAVGHCPWTVSPLYSPGHFSKNVGTVAQGLYAEKCIKKVERKDRDN